ncbi:hypothetical protein DHD08_13360 [Arenibacter sp. H213]|uniref:Uncharacterized protein n=1 Tax=Arenibacter antarcticus TaxID=2040469 RepID=A0ABW5VK01_9FLAO|nr:hypothetical protein [Arenibacter sp. H213]MCM4168671.1 hypothetical protein [Arenibacter sp. H213]
MKERKIKLIWDFRGQAAHKTALHHKVHLEEYKILNKLENSITGNLDINEMYAIAFLVVKESEMISVRDALRPHRGEVYTAEQ